ncbi:MAG TPA: RagB/SusD family nutrient uptake outer membrane protein [Chitinophagaceae bacterium]|nr:RagB/SusD family nutrient uptake outer membrane protein [Chitinophagaceae bacterium]
MKIKFQYKDNEQWIFISLLLFTGMSCKQFLDIPAPKNQIQTSEIFKNDQAAISTVSGLHSLMVTASLYPANGGITVFSGLSADEIYNTNSDPDIDGFTTNSLVPKNENVNTNLWSHVYKAIYHANAILEGLDQSATVSDNIKRQLRGEVLVIRALHYFYLVNMFGDVPLALSTNYEMNQTMSRTPEAEIYQQIISDLKEAKMNLPTAYPSNGRLRPNKWTATALLARAYLFLKDWANAEAQATEVINSGVYSLPSNLLTVFQPSSTETIWQLVRDNNNTSEGATFIPSSGTARPRYVLTNFLMNSFEAGDLRRMNWIGVNTVSNPPVNYYYPFKYKSRTATQATEYYVVLRLSEQYLIRAEARAQQNKLAGPNSAEPDINIIRTRAGLASTTASDKSSLLIAIAKERRTELFTEWGHRWFDLKRTKTADEVLTIAKAPNWQPTDALYPIPLIQLQLNPFLGQNPGY